MKEQQLIPGEAGILEGRMKYHSVIRINSISGEIFGGLHKEEKGAYAVKKRLVENARLMADIMRKDPKAAMDQAKNNNTIIYLKIGDTYYVNGTIFTHGFNDGTHGSKLI